MVANTDIKFYVHTNNNAPQLQDAYGSMINVLDACLTLGFDLPPVNSISINNLSMTIAFSANHNLLAGQVISIVGASDSKFNREFRVGSIPTPSSIEIDLDDTYPASVLGNISVKIPPLNWVNEYSVGGKRAYRNAETHETERPFLRVVDELDAVWGANYAKYAKVGIVSSMASVNDMSGLQTPYDLSNPSKNWIGSGSGVSAVNGWAKWYYSRWPDVWNNNYGDHEGATGGTRTWLLVGNGKWFYIVPSVVSGTDLSNIYFFGNLGDFYGLNSTLQYSSANNTWYIGATTGLSNSAESFLLHIGESRPLKALSFHSANDPLTAGNANYFETLDIQAVVSDVYISRVYNNKVYRVELPAFKRFLNPYDASFNLKTIESDGNVFLVKSAYGATSGAATEPANSRCLIGFLLT